MVYETFLNTIHTMVQQRLDGKANVSLQHVLKNNGVLLDGLSISSPSSHMAPTVYLNSYYDEAEKGLPLSIITDQIVLLYETDTGLQEEDALRLSDFQTIRRQIAYKLIHAKENQTLLQDLPHIRYLDLAIVFYFIVKETSEGQMTSLIRQEHLKIWNISEDELIQLATENTPRILPACLRSLEQTIENLDTFHLFPRDELPSVHLKVLTNNRGINGAACLLYPEILKNFANEVQDDIVLIPSSIHEVLIVPRNQALPVHELNAMIQYINQSEVPPEDRLSDHIYCYSRSQNCLYIPSSSRPSFSFSDETENLQ